MELVKRKTESLSHRNKLDNADDAVPSLLELYLTSPKLDYKDVVGMTVDLLLAGIDTVSKNYKCHNCLTFVNFLITL